MRRIIDWYYDPYFLVAFLLALDGMGWDGQNAEDAECSWSR